MTKLTVIYARVKDPRGRPGASGEPTGPPKHLTSDPVHGPLLGLDQVVLDPHLVEVSSPPPRAGEVAVRRRRLAPADPLLQRRERRVQPRYGDCRARYRLRNQPQV